MKSLKSIFIGGVLVMFAPFFSQAQVGVGTSSPTATAQLEVSSTTKGFLPPRMTTGQRDAIGSPAVGLIIYNITNGRLEIRSSSEWLTLVTLTGTETMTNKTLTSPTLTTPTLGVATATSINKVAITAPSSSATLTIANGKTLTANNSISLSGTDGTTMTFPSANATLASLNGTETLSNKTLNLPVITSGNDPYPSSLLIQPSTHSSSRRAAVWIDSWSLLQDVSGDGTKNFSITQAVSGTYPVRLFINTAGRIGIGNTSPIALLDIRPSPGNATPGDGYLAIGTAASTAASTAGAGAIRYSTSSGGILEYSNGASWNTLTSIASKSVVVAKNTNAGSYNSEFATNVVGWSEEVDINGNFDPVTGRFTAPRNGNYVFTFNYAFLGGYYGANTVIEAWMSCSTESKRRKQLIAAPSGNPAGRCGALISFTINLTSGESIWPTIWHNTGATRSLDAIGGNNFVNLSIVEL